MESTRKIWKIAEGEYREHSREYNGICLNCGCWTCGGVEPDAAGYMCEGCDKKMVCGAEMAMVKGRIEIVDDEAEIPESEQTKY